MNETKYDFRTDPAGPRGIAKASWLEKARLALMVIDVQNYITLPEYSGYWTASGGDSYYFRRCEQVVLPNIRRLLEAFRAHGCLVVYTRIAALNPNLRDVPGLARKVLAEETLDARGRAYRLLQEDRSSRIDERIQPRAEDVVLCKTASGAFCCADTDNVLRGNGIARLVFCGGLTDACLSSSAEDHEAALRSLRKFYGWMTSTEEIIAGLGIS